MERSGLPSSEGAPERDQFIDATSHLNSKYLQETIGEAEMQIYLNDLTSSDRSEIEASLQNEIFGWRKLPRRAEIKGTGTVFRPDTLGYEAFTDVEVTDAEIIDVDMTPVIRNGRTEDFYKGTIEVWSHDHQALFYFYLDQIESIAIATNSINGENVLESLNTVHTSIVRKASRIDFLAQDPERQEQALWNIIRQANKKLDDLASKKIELHAEAYKFYVIYDGMDVVDLDLQSNHAAWLYHEYSMEANGILTGCSMADLLQWSGTRMDLLLPDGKAFQFDNGAPCIRLRNDEKKCTYFVPINQIKSLD